MSDSEEETTEKQIKIVFIGEPNVGKTSLIRRFCYDEFSRQYNPTIGADFFIKRILLPGRKEITVKITDIGGQELKAHMLSNYLFNVNIIVLVYDITSCISFDSMSLWIDTIRSIIDEYKPVIIVFGNKCDMEHKRAVRLDKTKNFVNENKLLSFLVSAKTGETVSSCLTEIIAKYFGIPLSRIEKERQTPVVRAELVVPSSAEVHRQNNVRSYNSYNNTSVCCLQ